MALVTKLWSDSMKIYCIKFQIRPKVLILVACFLSKPAQDKPLDGDFYLKTF